ncbi:MAG: hypothetical protein OIF40_04025 [Mangrovicoccus sp.]|nr:hypothetical protein [Mangrovicoccus sp.]
MTTLTRLLQDAFATAVALLLSTAFVISGLMVLAAVSLASLVGAGLSAVQLPRLHHVAAPVPARL